MGSYYYLLFGAVFTGAVLAMKLAETNYKVLVVVRDKWRWMLMI
jgi:UDP-galactopyranose mutase